MVHVNSEDDGDFVFYDWALVNLNLGSTFLLVLWSISMFIQKLCENFQSLTSSQFKNLFHGNFLPTPLVSNLNSGSLNYDCPSQIPTPIQTSIGLLPASSDALVIKQIFPWLPITPSMM
jgi:hypothetical protein